MNNNKNYSDKLLKWTIFYVKNKDIIKKELINYKILKNFIEFTYKNNKHIYYIYAELNDNVLKEIKDNCSVICLNNKNNFNFIIKNWDVFIKRNKSSIIFVNPNLNEKWIVSPKIHNSITEKNNLKKSLLCLYKNVIEVK